MTTTWGGTAPRAAMCAAAGCLAGPLLWLGVESALPHLSNGVRFAVAVILFVAGPGWAVAGGLARNFDWISRLFLCCTTGLVVTPLLAHALGLLHALEAFPFVASAMTGLAVARRCMAPSAETALPTRGRAIGALIVAAAAVAICAVVYSNRLTMEPDLVVVSGDYDSFDTTYYAAIAAEVAYRIPPTAPFNAGHMLNYAYYPHLVLGLVHRFAEVPLLPMYFGLAWPVYLTLAGLGLFTLVAHVAAPATATVAALLFLIGSDLSWILVLLGPPETYLWDPVVWSANTFSPGPETLSFNTFAPAMAVLFAAVAASVEAGRSGQVRWIALAALLVAGVLQYKPFAYADLVAGLGAAAMIPGLSAASRRRYLLVLGLSLLLASPFFYTIVLYYGESQSHLTVDFFLMPGRMLEKLTISDDFTAAAAAAGVPASLRPLVTAAAATPLFFALGLGYRTLGVGRLWKALRGNLDPTSHLVAWIAVAGAAIPFVIVTEPYHQTLHFYQVTLFLMPVFVAHALARLRPGRKWVATALVFAIAAPSTLHFLYRKAGDAARPVGRLEAPELAVAAYLQTLNRERTVLLHDSPGEPSLLMIEGNVRSALAWARYVPNSQTRRREIERFFRRGDRSAENVRQFLVAHRATHLLVDRRRHRFPSETIASLLPVVESGPLTLYWVPGSPSGEVPR